MEAFSDAGKLALEGFQAVLQRQAEVIPHMVTDTSSIMQETAKECTAAEKADKHSDLVQKTYEKSVKNWHELAGIIGKSGKEASDVCGGPGRLDSFRGE